jgi:hypothetical protein
MVAGQPAGRNCVKRTGCGTSNDILNKEFHAARTGLTRGRTEAIPIASSGFALCEKGTGMRELLEKAGFRVHGKRANCRYCKGSSRLTVSFTHEVAFCHRCHWTANVTQLAEGQGRTIAQRKVGLARLCKRRFFDWLDKRYREMAAIDYRTARKAALAKAVLFRFPDCEPAWAALANRYHAERALNAFFEAASDKTGRFLLYRQWRRANAAA